MAWRRFGVVQGKTAAALFAVLLWVGACGDSSVNFGPDVGQGDDDDDDSGGSSATAGTGNGSGGTTTTAGTATSGGTESDEGGAGSSSGGTEAGGSERGGSTSGGTEAGGSSAGSGGTDVAGTGGNGGGGGATGGAGGANGGMGGSTAGASGSGGSGGAGPVTCTNGFFGGHGYAFCSEVDSAMAGYEKCQSLGMNVVTIESKQENEYVLGKQKSNTWLGGTDDEHEKDWIWATGVYFTKNDKPVQGVYSNWLEGQPNNENKDGLDENCLVMTSTGSWNDIACGLGGSKVTCESTGPTVPPIP